MKIRPYIRNGKKVGWRADIFVRLSDGTRIRERPVYRDVTKEAAKEAAKKRAIEITNADGQIDKSKIPTLEEFKATFLEQAVTDDLKDSTRYARESILDAHLIPALGSKRLDQITQQDVHDLKLRLLKRDGDHKPRTAKTVRNVLSTLSKLLRVAKDLGKIEKLPIERFKLPKIGSDAVPPFYTFAEYKALIAAAAKRDPRTLVAVLLGGDAGLRPGEIVGLEWPDVSRANGAITIERQVWRNIVGSPKSGKGRVVPMTARLAAALQAARHLRSARVLLQDGDEPRPITAKALRGWMKSAQRLAGLKPTGNAHILRHTFCSHLAMRGAPAKVIQELAGHAHLSTTMRYMHLQKGAKEAAIALLSESTPPARDPALAT